MRSTLICFLALFASPIPDAALQPTDGLVAAWPGNGDAHDVRGRDPGTAYGVSYVPFLGRRGFHFNGDNSVVFIPDFPNLHLTHSLSLTALIQIDSVDEGTADQILFRGDNRPGLDPYVLAVQSGKGKDSDRFGQLIFLIQSGNPFDSQGIAGPVPLRRPIAVAATLDDASNAMRLYVDGRLVAMTLTRTRPAADLDHTADPGVAIGNTQDPATYNEPFHGTAADVRIYDRALTAAEIRTLAAPLAPKVPGSKAGPSGRRGKAP